jgi:hypothetical protein
LRDERLGVFADGIEHLRDVQIPAPDGDVLDIVPDKRVERTHVLDGVRDCEGFGLVHVLDLIEQLDQLLGHVVAGSDAQLVQHLECLVEIDLCPLRGLPAAIDLRQRSRG